MPIRWQSAGSFMGRPWIAVAVGPDFAHNEFRGHARGIIAIGDMATGWVALGGLARGILAFGGLAVGAVTLGGLSVGVLAVGGLALGGFAFGGAAIGPAAAGGLAVGYYALGGTPFGEHVCGPLYRDPQAVEFFTRILPGWLKLPLR